VKIPGFFRTFGKALAAWWNDGAARLGASLAYYTLFALAPILLIAIAIAGWVFGAEAVRGELVGQVEGLMGREGAEAVQALLRGARRENGGALAAIIGGAAFVLTSTGAFLELQTAFNTIWRVEPKPGASVKKFLVNRAQSFGLVLAIGFLLLVSLVINTLLAAAAGWVERQAPLVPLFWDAANFVTSLGVITVLFAMLFKFLPDVELRWRDVWTGALVTSLLFGIGKYVIGLYIARSATATSYGATGSVLVVLLWVYYSAQILLLGAEYTRVRTQERRGAPKTKVIADKAETRPRRAKALP